MWCSGLAGARRPVAFLRRQPPWGGADIVEGCWMIARPETSRASLTRDATMAPLMTPAAWVTEPAGTAKRGYSNADSFSAYTAQLLCPAEPAVPQAAPTGSFSAEQRKALRVPGVAGQRCRTT